MPGCLKQMAKPLQLHYECTLCPPHNATALNYYRAGNVALWTCTLPPADQVRRGSNTTGAVAHGS